MAVPSSTLIAGILKCARADVREFVNVQPSTDRKAKRAQVLEFMDLVQRDSLQIEEDDV